MNNLLEVLLSVFPNFKGITLQEITCNNSTIGFKATITDKNSYVISGGTASSKDLAIRIAISEAFERSLVKKIDRNNDDRKKFLLNQFPSTSGFAAGFKKENARFRSICEGLERWIWSKWIDEGYKLNEIPTPPILSALSKHLIGSFKEYKWFQNKFSLKTSEHETIDLEIIVFLGCTEEGIFPGSRVTTSLDNKYEHPIIEASRSLENFLIHQEKRITLDNIIKERTIFYGHNKNIALDQISKANKTSWPQPEIQLLKEFDTGHPEIFLYRCLMKDFIGWHEGDVTRFVY